MTGVLGRARERWDHRWSSQRIQDYVDGDLLTPDRRRLEDHTHKCEECGPLLRSLLCLRDRLRDLRQPTRTAVAPAIVRRLRAESQLQPTGHNGRIT
jgi:anti-sigma factor RsiW